ncbi:hypothetical protein IRJ41_019116 [Triplophysa rosa]|uniref:Uncharacterized protein n=1 Tax=Triplophysa rosa TaxID=992332 RepID=A0A9W7T6M5_TRIRA|nr:hypothetical protein IRJ41_019116 [Triplophysa rosa]
MCVTDRGVECMECFKKLLSCWFYCLLERAKGMREEGGVHAVSLFLRPVRTLSETQPELINSNRPPHYPQCTRLCWGPVEDIASSADKREETNLALPGSGVSRRTSRDTFSVKVGLLQYSRAGFLSPPGTTWMNKVKHDQLCYETFK